MRFDRARAEHFAGRAGHHRSGGVRIVHHCLHVGGFVHRPLKLAKKSMTHSSLHQDPDGHFDVALVGFGPVGAVLANLLVQQGLRVTAFEREADIYALPRAIALDAECMRVMQAIGVADTLAEQMVVGSGMRFVNAQGRLLIDWTRPPGIGPQGWHPSYRYHQPSLETTLRARLSDCEGFSLRRRHEVFAIDEADGQVRLRVEDLNAGRLSEVRADWVVGCDGARSTVRRFMGTELDDLRSHERWLVVDVILKRERPDLGDHSIQYCDPARPSTYVRGVGQRRRWELMLLPGEDPVQMTRPERIWSLLSKWVTPEDADLERPASYTFHSVVANGWRRGRLLIAGDAAHQTPPFLGQGLCAGIRDGANLSWKLQMVAAGAAGEQLLDTYDVERRPHAAGLVAHAVDMGRLIDQLAGRGGGSDDLENAYGGQRPFPHLTSGLLAGEHPFVGRQVMNPIVGGRRLDVAMGAGWAVVTADPSAIEGEVLDRWRSLGAEVVTTDALDAAAVYVVRPDRQVAAVAAGVEEFVDASRSLLTGMGLVFA